MRSWVGLGAVAVFAVVSAAQPQSSLVLQKRRPVTLRVRLEKRVQPGFVKSLDSYVPHTLSDRRRFRYQLKRLLTFVTGRWVPDTTSFSTIFRRFDELPSARKQKALVLAAVGPAAMWAQGWTRRQFRRYKVPLVEPGAEGVRLKRLRLGRWVQAWHEWRISRRTYTYLYVPLLRAVGFYSRSLTYASAGVWCSPRRRWSVSVQRAKGRSWRATTITVQHYSSRTYLSWQAQRIESRWSPGWNLYVSWAWVR